MDMKRILLPFHGASLSSGAVLVLSTTLILALAGCATTGDEPAPEPDTGSEFSDAAATVEPPAPVVVVVEWTNPGMVHFEFDSSDIRADAVSVLEAAAEQLNATGIKVIIAGYCDNRGTEEYNLALGDRRASAVRRYLTNLGVPPDQMMVVSYGELRPLRRDNNEAAWAENRRAEFEPAG
jgi:peptidoglycan-associated lipoprotein